MEAALECLLKPNRKTSPVDNPPYSNTKPIQRPNPLAEQQAKANGRMDAYVSKAPSDLATAKGEGTIMLEFLALQIQAMHDSTTNIEKDTRDIKFSIREIEAKLGTLTTRVDDMEDRVVALEESRDPSETELVTFGEELEKVRAQLDNLDNRGRRCNIKIMGLPESKEGKDMIKFLQHELPVMLYHTFGELEIQLAHPVGAPSRAQGERERPRPVIVNMLRYRDKEEILLVAREKGQIIWQGVKIMFFPDCWRETMDRRMSFNQVKAALRQRQVEYALRFPAIHEIKHNGFRHRFTSPGDAAEFIAKKIPKGLLLCSEAPSYRLQEAPSYRLQEPKSDP
uniref:L1 transposable element RRM domain-containing protein n=1 Tax=Fundulus heteroclitus TaxID=8078 RepID=A0A3Q2QL80_FUNHE